MTDIAVITGGAGGMGLQTAKILGRDRTVLISDICAERLAGARAELTALGINAEVVQCDITDAASVTELVNRATALGRVTAVVHAAGISPSMGSAEQIVKVNAAGTVHINEGFLHCAAEGFVIVNVASMAAHMLPRTVWPTRTFRGALRDEEAFITTMMAICRLAPETHRAALAYAMSKAFVLWYSRFRARRFGELGARILSVSPGSIDTDMGRLEERAGAGAMIEHAALRRFGAADEIAELLAFCAGDRAGYLTGTDILCDGGVVASMTWRDKIAMRRYR